MRRSQRVEVRQHEFGEWPGTYHAQGTVPDVQAGDPHAGCIGKQLDQRRVTLGNPVKQIREERGAVCHLEKDPLANQFLRRGHDPMNRGSARRVPEKGRHDAVRVSPLLPRLADLVEEHAQRPPPCPVDVHQPLEAVEVGQRRGRDVGVLVSVEDETGTRGDTQDQIRLQPAHQQHRLLTPFHLHQVGFDVVERNAENVLRRRRSPAARAVRARADPGKTARRRRSPPADGASQN